MSAKYKNKAVDESEFKITRLVDLDVAGGVKNMLIERFDSNLPNIPLFIYCPPEHSLWAIPKNYREKLKGYREELKDYGEDESTFSQTKYELICPSLLKQDNILLQLSNTDIKSLLAFSNIKVNQFPKAYKLVSGKLAFESLDPVASKRYFPGIFKLARDKTNICNQIRINDLPEAFDFTLCDVNKTTFDTVDDPLNDLSSIEITWDDCFIQAKSERELIGDKKVRNAILVANIPEGSKYFVREGCRHSSLLNKLAALGYEIYDNKSIEEPKNLAKYIASEFDVVEKLAETCAFFISPKPKGKMNPDSKGKLQFQNLIFICQEFYLGGKRDKNKNIKSSENMVSNRFGGKFGYSDEKCRYAEKIITPDNKK